MTTGEFLTIGACSPVADAEATLNHAGPDASAIFYQMKKEIDLHQYNHVQERLQAFWEAYNAYQKLLNKATYQLRKARKNTLTIGRLRISYCPVLRMYFLVEYAPLSVNFYSMKAGQAKQIIAHILAA